MSPPPSKRSKIKPPHRKKIKCPVPPCRFEAYQHQQIDSHLDARHICTDCNDTFPNIDNHVCPNQGGRAGEFGPIDLELGAFTEVESSHRGILKLYRFVPEGRLDEIESIYDAAENDLTSLLTQLVDHYCGIRVQLIVHVRLADMVHEISEDTFLTAPSWRLMHRSRVDEIITMAAAYQIEKLNEYVTRGSMWQLDRIYSLDVNCAAYVPLAGAGRSIRLPRSLANSQSIISFDVRDSKCFHISVCVALHFNELERSQQRQMSSYEPFLTKYKFDQLTIPVPVIEIPIFEELNEISVNVFTHKGAKVFPIHISAFPFEKVCDLILLTENEESHYATITSFDRFLGKSGKPRHYYCKKCMQGMTSPEILEKHKRNCKFVSPIQKIDFPEPGTPEAQDTFQSEADSLLSYAYGVVDFESFLNPLQRCGQNPKESWEEKISLHQPAAYSFIVFNQTAEIIHQNYHDVLDEQEYGVVDHFLFTAERIAMQVLDLQREKDQQIMSDYERQEYLKTLFCKLCGRTFNDKIIKVAHHQHGILFTRKDEFGNPYRYNHICALCRDCNLKLRYKKRLTVLAHGLSNYDGRIILKYMREYKAQIKVISKNGQKFMQMMIGRHLRLIDFFNHMSSSLRSLVDDMRLEGLHRFRLTRSCFSQYSDEQLDMIMLKQFFPYSFLTDVSKLSYARVPDKKHFFNDMADTPISDDDYAHVQKVWNLTGCENMREYTQLYCTLDTLLLGDVILLYVENCYRTTELDPIHSISIPSFAYKTMRKATQKQRLDRITDSTMLPDLRKCIRGGLNMSVQRLAYSNIKCHNGMYDPSKPLAEIFCFDVNSLYAYCQSQSLPVGGYRWLSDAEISTFDPYKYDDNLGAIVVCDLFSPQDPEWQRKHQMLPFAPEKFKLTYDNLSRAQQTILKDMAGPSNSLIAAEKLLLTFWPHFEYPIYAKELQFYLDRGMILGKVHRVIEFRQAKFLESFINRFIQLRTESPAETMKAFLKTLLNSLFGKWIQNVLSFNDMLICRSRQTAAKYLARQNYKSHYIVNPDVSVFLMSRTNVKFRQLYPIGCAILSLAKLRMYELFYCRLMPVFPDMRLLGGDTDSLIVMLRYKPGQEDLVEPMKLLADIFDFSNLHESDPLYNTDNRGVCGLLKNELGHYRVIAFAQHSPKKYKFLLFNPYKFEFGKKSRSKGIPRVYLDRLSFNEFRDAMFEADNRRVEFCAIRGHNMEMSTVRVNKRFLSSFISHRFLCSDRVTTLPWGSVAINT